MFGGKILVHTRKTVPGSHRQEAWQDVWQDSIDLKLPEGVSLDDPAVQQAVREAFYKSQQCAQQQSSWGQLRWRNGDGVAGFDTVNNLLLISCSVSLAD